MPEYDHDRTVYATSPEEQGEVSTGTGEEYDEQYHDPNWLHTQYHALGKSQKEIADICGVGQPCIHKWMSRHGIESRDRPHATSMAISERRVNVNNLWDKDWMRKKYTKEKKTVKEIAKELGASVSTVHRALGRLGIDARDPSSRNALSANKKYGERKYNNEDWLRHQYLKQGKSAREIADENDWSERSVRDALKRHGIRSRSITSANLLRYKKEKCVSGGSKRELVSSEGIDATWRDIQNRDQSCYLQYRDPTWLREQVERGFSDHKIADRCNVEVARETIGEWRQRFGIERDENTADSDS